MASLRERDVLPGKVLRGMYAVTGRVGSGAVSDVYLANQRSVGNRNVAVKVLKKVICASKDAEAEVHRARFRREAELLALLKHGVFARLIDAGVLKDGDVERPYMVLEYLPGQLVSTVVEKGALPPVEAARVVFLLAEALVELHRYQVVYRDLSPGNVILEEAGPGQAFPRLFDFSHATVRGVGGMDSAGAAAVVLAGTPPWAAPEQASGTADERADLFALAGLAYLLFAGRPPLTLPGGGWQDYKAAVQRGIRLPEVPLRRLGKKLPRGLDDVLARALSLEPDARQESVAVFLQEFAEVLVNSDLVTARAGGLSALLGRLLLK